MSDEQILAVLKLPENPIIEFASITNYGCSKSVSVTSGLGERENALELVKKIFPGAEFKETSFRQMSSWQEGFNIYVSAVGEG